MIINKMTKLFVITAVAFAIALAMPATITLATSGGAGGGGEHTHFSSSTRCLNGRRKRNSTTGGEGDIERMGEQG